jgi:kynurenine formamidase
MDQSQNPKKITLEEFESLARKYKNWGRWGNDDQLGTLNFITPSSVTRAAGEIKRGRSISLAIPLDSNGPQNGTLNRFNPIHLMIRHGGDAALEGIDKQIHSADDVVLMALQAGTHWDALSHIFHEGRIYNNRSIAEVNGYGAKKNGIEHVSDKIVGRGILLDIPRVKKTKWLKPSELITPEDLDLAVKMENLEVAEGDILLVRTGQMGIVKEKGNWQEFMTRTIPGLSVGCLEWIAEHKISAVAADNWAVEVVPYETEYVLLPFHVLGIVYMGLTLGEVFDLEELARDCAQDGRYSFFLSASPLPFTGAVGAPVNPIATK